MRPIAQVSSLRRFQTVLVRQPRKLHSSPSIYQESTPTPVPSPTAANLPSADTPSSSSADLIDLPSAEGRQRLLPDLSSYQPLQVSRGARLDLRHSTRSSGRNLNRVGPSHDAKAENMMKSENDGRRRRSDIKKSMQKVQSDNLIDGEGPSKGVSLRDSGQSEDGREIDEGDKNLDRSRSKRGGRKMNLGEGRVSMDIISGDTPSSTKLEQGKDQKQERRRGAEKVGNQGKKREKREWTGRENKPRRQTGSEQKSTPDVVGEKKLILTEEQRFFELFGKTSLISPVRRVSKDAEKNDWAKGMEPAEAGMYLT
ncbi:hypothetical protein TREMEDRAFT_59808 [Tremella mesenterica DSM 1558]|uniref:uncharacterized protein n=1 Tax=Tremella mesenterica (strain ATCC 24925 / CBS 8224 / DSM 1558 / NBRC 9311 / NRRL Y-6157 / RJB 2259-6 / UBC 559-6) TaxID=578456 RepID=UPI0003F49349|nr:uncharacterized protein TREMEDRAFT_59808 [Tremella mesenterica DSM 1558]EIW73636.1 hypothetical protein TREMEDRAFT_59808 [Tremella mesenterica DSM 1558]